jgi:protein-S-isoprenylcysteine O-methyltransferase Ste14
MTRGSSRWSEFRARGGIWVLTQFAVIAAIAAAWFLPPSWPEEVQRPLGIAGVVLAVAGVGLVGWAYRSLGSSFTAYTRPPPAAKRVATGPYRLVRHPMYGGGILLFTGISLAHSITSLALTIALATLWRAKSAAEERILLVRFPDYATYRQHTRRRFWPYVY